MKTLIKTPDECTLSELDEFERMASESGQVDLPGLRIMIERAKKLIFIIEEDTCIGIAGIKNPREAYKNRVFNAAGVGDRMSDYPYEVGYIFTKVRGKGVGRLLMEATIKAVPNAITFATTQASNNAMQYLLPKFGFAKLGDSYLKHPLREGEDAYYLDLFGKETVSRQNITKA